ncbi:TPA: efflux RND transporter periplasmic adaptor subunit [Klebsiella pneumoniae]|nr:efflux RND transporter periplasmic adaptor subunit [Klebsiella pneumoniae]
MLRLNAVHLAVCLLPLALAGCGEPADHDDPRIRPPLVRVATVERAEAGSRAFTGVVVARTQSDLGFRVAGKVLERRVETGQSVKRGQLLLRLDPADLALQAQSQQRAVDAARARAQKAANDLARYRGLVASGAISAAEFDQINAAAEAARADLSAAQAQANVAQNATGYAGLLADADGVVVETLAEPGQVVSAGQVVIRLARAGQREARVQLPETLRPAVGSEALATRYGSESQPVTATLRLLSDAADATTRTFEARYVLNGALANAPLGSTVTLRIGNDQAPGQVLAVPLASVYDPGNGPGVWRIASRPATVSWQPVTVLGLNDETARVTGPLKPGEPIVALGLLVDDAIIAIEMMVVKMEEGYDRLKASAYAWSHTAAPMLAGTLVTAVGFMPNGFAQSTAGEYASNVFWIVGIALIASWIVAVIFTPWLGVHLLPDRKPAAAGHAALYDTPRYQRFRRLLTRVIARKWRVAAGVVALFIVASLGMSVVKKQFFPTSDRPEVLVEVQLPYGSSISQTSAAAAKIEHWLQRQPEAKIVTSYIGQGAPRFYLAMAPELPDPSFAKLVVLTDGQGAREALKRRLREAVANGLAPEARVRVTQLVFGPYSPYPVAWRVMGPDPHALLDIAERVKSVLQASPLMRTVNTDWGSRVPVMHFSLNQDRLQASGLSSQSVAQQLQFLLSGIPITTVREDIRAVQVIGRAAGDIRLDPAKIADFTLVGSGGQRVPLSQIGDVSIRMEDPLLRRRDRTPTITVRGDVAENLQPPDVSTALMKPLQPIIDSLPPGYRIETAGSIEESGKATRAMVPLFPIMIALTLLIIILQVRSLSAMVMVFLTAPLGLIGVVPTLLLFNQPFGINALVGLIALSGILMRNTLILIGQIHHNQQAGLDPFHAVVEATVQRARPVLLTALAAILAFIPLTQSVFWGTLAYTLIGGTLGGTIMTLIFLPAMYAIWFRIRPANTVQQTELHLQR